MTTFPVFKQLRLAELITEQWGDIRIPDLIEVQKFARPRRLLEIGCYRGVSTEFWLLHCQYVLAVDPWPDFAVRRQFLNRCSHYPNLEYIVGPSPEALRGRHRIADGHEGFDTIYIDGDHSYAAVMNDIRATLPMLQDYGVMAGHDYHGTQHDEVMGVARAVDEVFGGNLDRWCSDGSWAVRVPNPKALLKEFEV